MENRKQTKPDKTRVPTKDRKSKDYLEARKKDNVEEQAIFQCKTLEDGVGRANTL